MSAVLTQFNTALAGTGITAALSGATGALVFKGNSAFTVTDGGNTASITTALTSTLTTATKSMANTTVNNYDSTGWAVPTGNSLTFNVGTTTSTVKFTSADSNVSHAVQTLNTGLAGTGIAAVVDQAGTGISFQSANSFSMDTPSSNSSAVYGGTSTSGSSYTPTTPAQSGIGNAESAITAINSAIQSLGFVQGSVGAGENKLQYAINLAQSQVANFSKAESQIRDADVAAEAANLTKASVLSQTSIAAMAQANSEPQSILKLLQ